MKKTKVKIPAKINLALDVVGVKDGFHMLETLVASVNIFDEIVVKKRTDGKITLTERGIKSGCPLEKNNAYKAAKRYIETFGEKGADIILKKNIPVGGGLGGSSADIAGVLKGLNILFGGNRDIKPLADELGSDSGYMLNGGYAILRGKGDIEEKVNFSDKIYLLIIKEEGQVNSGACYKTFDELGKTFPPSSTLAAKKLEKGDFEKFCSLIKNDLTSSAVKILPNIGKNIDRLKSTLAKAALMTGSGSCSFAVFENKNKRDKAYKKLKKEYGKKLIKANTIV